MGSFNVSCGISNMSLNPGDNAGLIPLLPSYMQGYPSEIVRIGATTNLVSNEGVYHLFTPFCLPIFGKYDDYGDLGDIQHDSNTKAIEDFFGTTIEKFLTILTAYDEQIDKDVIPWFDTEDKLTDTQVRKLKLLKRMGGMFIHGDVYNELSKKQIGEYSNSQNEALTKHKAYVNHEVLLKCGFEFSHENKKMTRYTQIYKYPGEDRYVIRSDKTWSHIYDTQKNEDVNESTFHPDDLAVAWKKVTGETFDVDEIFGDETYYEHLYDVLRKKVIKYGLPNAEVLYETVELEYPSIEKQKEAWRTLKEAFDRNDGNIRYFDYGAKDPIYIQDKYSFDFSKETYMFTNADFKHGEFVAKPIGGKYTVTSCKDLLSNVSYYNDPLSDISHSGGDDLFGYFKNWHYFTNLYREAIRNGELRKDFSDFLIVYWAMFGNNKLFMPSFNGYQCGAIDEELNLTRIKLDIILDRKGDRIEEAIDIKQYDSLLYDLIEQVCKKGGGADKFNKILEILKT